MARWDQNGSVIAETATSPQRWDEKGNVIGAAPATPALQPKKALTLEGAGIAAPHKPSGMLETASSWMGDAVNDVRSGNDSTVVGKALKFFGAKGTDSGNSHEVGEYMASPVIGPMRMIQGATQIPQPGKFKEGVKNVAGGAWQAAQIPAAFMGGPGTDKAATAIDKAVPSTARAEELFQKVSAAANHVPIDTTEARQVALAAQDLSEHGSPSLKIMKDFAEKSAPAFGEGAHTPVSYAPGSNGNSSFRPVDWSSASRYTPAPVARPTTVIPGASPVPTGPTQALTYEGGRKFATNAGALAVSEGNRMNKPMERQVALLSKALATANEAAAESAGVGNEYRQAMTEYRRAQQMKSGIKTAAKFGVPAVVGGGAASYYAKKALGL